MPTRPHSLRAEVFRLFALEIALHGIDDMALGVFGLTVGQVASGSPRAAAIGSGHARARTELASLIQTIRL